MSQLQVSNLEKVFNLHLLNKKQIHSLKEVSFEVEQGEFMGIIGRSGSGKSSLLKCIYRTYLPTNGSIFYSGSNGETQDLAVMPANEILQLRTWEIGYVSQFLRPIPRVTAIRLVAEPLLQRGFSSKEALSKAAETMEGLHLPRELWDSHPVLFSGGEQQRVNLARAIIARPSLLLLDEPTASLDSETQEAVISMLREVKESGTTMLGVFHDTDVLYRLADKIMVLNEGRIEEIRETEPVQA